MQGTPALFDLVRIERARHRGRLPRGDARLSAGIRGFPGSQLVRLAERPRAFARRKPVPVRRDGRRRRRERLGLSSRDRRSAGPAPRRRDRDGPVARRSVGADADRRHSSFSCRSARDSRVRSRQAIFPRLRSAPSFRMASVSCFRPPRRAMGRASTSNRSKEEKPTAISGEGVYQSRVSVSPDGALVAAIGPDSKVHLYPTAGGSVIDLAESQVGDYPSGWTADGKGLTSPGAARPAASTSSTSLRAAARTCAILPAATPPASLHSAPPVSRPTAGSMTVGFSRILSTLYQSAGTSE